MHWYVRLLPNDQVKASIGAMVYTEGLRQHPLMPVYRAEAFPGHRRMQDLEMRHQMHEIYREALVDLELEKGIRGKVGRLDQQQRASQAFITEAISKFRQLGFAADPVDEPHAKRAHSSNTSPFGDKFLSSP